MIFFKGTYGNDPNRVTHVGIYLYTDQGLVYFRHASSAKGEVTKSSFMPGDKPFFDKHFHSYGSFLYDEERVDADRAYVEGMP